MALASEHTLFSAPQGNELVGRKFDQRNEEFVSAQFHLDTALSHDIHTTSASNGALEKYLLNDRAAQGDLTINEQLAELHVLESLLATIAVRDASASIHHTEVLIQLAERQIMLDQYLTTLGPLFFALDDVVDFPTANNESPFFAGRLLYTSTLTAHQLFLQDGRHAIEAGSFPINASLQFQLFSPLPLSLELCSFFFYQTVSFISIGAEANARPLGETWSVVFIE